MNKFQLVYESDREKTIFGELRFNGSYIFHLRDNVDYDTWEKYGIIPVNKETRMFESSDLFDYVNSRLPIQLREASKDQKIDYIKKTGLRVPSDNFYFEYFE